MKRINLLIVDDDVEVCRLFRHLLEPLGYEVETETDPFRVLKILMDGDFDALRAGIDSAAVNGDVFDA